MSKLPNRIDIYMYNVFFGDCFLLQFIYESKKRSVLIDFGSTGKDKDGIDENDEIDKESTGKRMLRVAKHIAETCENKLDVVVATHRHKDHISGFGLKEAGKIIAGLKPTIVIQPWTEDPADKRDLSKKRPSFDQPGFKEFANFEFTSMLDDMNRVSSSIADELGRHELSDGVTDTRISKLHELALFAANDNGIKNVAAVKNLGEMGRNHYVHFGYDSIDWDAILPGVDVEVLGPSSLEQSTQILQATGSSDEFWSLRDTTNSYWGMQAATGMSPAVHENEGSPLFGEHEAYTKWRPPNARWIIDRLRDMRLHQLYEIVKYVDGALNNTSVILLFSVGEHSLLFPGDAQIENWAYLMDACNKDPKLAKRLAGTTVYKVGHHGSRNATPLSVWKDFELRTEDIGQKRLLTLLSTMKGKHGESENTRVPLDRMVAEMRRSSDLYLTEDIKGDFFKKISLET